MGFGKRKDGPGIFGGVFAAYLILLLHLLLIAGLGLLVLFFRGFITYMIWVFLGGTAVILGSAYYFFRRLKAEGKNLRDIVNSPAFRGKSLEVSLLGGAASVKIGNNSDMKALPDAASPPTLQLEEPGAVQVRELSKLARLYENDLITLDEFNAAKARLFGS